MKFYMEHLLHMGTSSHCSLHYAHNQGRGGDKLASKSRKCIFVGYPHGKNGWKLYDLEIHSFFLSRDVFHENIFPFAEET